VDWIEIISMTAIAVFALAVLALMSFPDVRQPSISALFLYWPDLYAAADRGDADGLRPWLSGLTCWLNVGGTWVQITNGSPSPQGIATRSWKLVCR